MLFGRTWLIWFSLICACWLNVGGVIPAGATEDEVRIASESARAEGETRSGGRGEGFEPEGGAAAKEEGSKEEAAGDECPATFGPIITDTAVPIEKGKFAVQPTFGLSFITDSLTQSWRRVSAGGDFSSFAMDWKFTYGLWNNLEAFVVIPYAHKWASSVNEPGPSGERDADFGGIGDINLTFKYCLLEETHTRPTLTALFAMDFPTGHFKRLNPRFLGTDEIGGGICAFTTGLNLSKYIKPLIVYGNLWYTMRTDYTTDDGRQNPRDFVTLNLAAEYPITEKWVALMELTSYWDSGRLIGHKANTPPGALLSVMPGIEYMATEKFSLALGLNIDAVGKNADAAITPLLSMVYAF